MPSPQDIAKQQIEAAFAQDWDKLRKLYSANVQYIDPDGAWNGRDAAIAHLREGVEPIPDASYELKYVGGDDRVAVAEWSLTGTNTGPLTMPDGSQLPATGKRLSLNVVTLYDVQGGEIVSERNYWDNMAAYAQLGLLPEEATA